MFIFSFKIEIITLGKSVPVIVQRICWSCISARNNRICGKLALSFMVSVAHPEILFAGGIQQIRLRTENRENGDLGAVAP
jgi:hypothetical protein